MRDDSSSLDAHGLEQLAVDRQLAAYRHEGFWQCMDTLREKRWLRRPLAVRAGAVEGMVTVDDSWHGRPVFVTGATGIVGSWLVKDLLARDARVVALVHDPDPQSEFYRSEDYRRTSIVHGRLEDYWTLERTINEQEIDTVFHLAAQPIVGVAQRYPLQDV